MAVGENQSNVNGDASPPVARVANDSTIEEFEACHDWGAVPEVYCYCCCCCCASRSSIPSSRKVDQSPDNRNSSSISGIESDGATLTETPSSLSACPLHTPRAGGATPYSPP